jgi:hypothetical protein
MPHCVRLRFIATCRIGRRPRPSLLLQCCGASHQQQEYCSKGQSLESLAFLWTALSLSRISLVGKRRRYRYASRTATHVMRARPVPQWDPHCCQTVFGRCAVCHQHVLHTHSRLSPSSARASRTFAAFPQWSTHQRAPS